MKAKNGKVSEGKDGEKEKKRKFGNRFRKIRIKDVLLTPRHEKLSEVALAKLCDSMRINRQINPITVRLAPEPNNGKYVLIAGAHRRAAAQRIGKKFIEARVVKADDDQAMLIELSENLFRKGQSVLTRAEHLTEYLGIAKKYFDFSGQLDRKPETKRTSGRPLGEARRILERLPGIGTSIEARRKNHARARLIARIDPEAKRIARKAKIDNNQRALLKIAAQRSSKGQIRVAAALDAALAVTKLGKGADRKVKSNTHASAKTEKRKENKKEVRSENTSFDDLLAVWNKHVAKLWLYSPQDVRSTFLDQLHRTRRRSKDDVVGFVKNVFRGRRSILVQDLFAYAKSKGIRVKDVRKVLKHLVYKRRRANKRAPLFYLNIDSNWKGQVTTVPNEEILAAVTVATRRDAEEMAKSTARLKTSKEKQDYFKID